MRIIDRTAYSSLDKYIILRKISYKYTEAEKGNAT